MVASEPSLLSGQREFAEDGQDRGTSVLALHRTNSLRRALRPGSCDSCPPRKAAPKKVEKKSAVKAGRSAAKSAVASMLHIKKNVLQNMTENGTSSGKAYIKN